MVFVNKKLGNGFRIKNIDSSKDQEHYFTGVNKEVRMTIRFLSGNLDFRSSNLNNDNVSSLGDGDRIVLYPHLYDSQNFEYYVPLTGNLILNSNDYNDGNFDLVNVTSTDKSVEDPFGGMGAAALTESVDGANAVHWVRESAVVSPKGRNTYSVFAKAVGRDYIILANTAYDGTFKGAYFNIASGAVGGADAGLTASIVDHGNGWYLCSIEYIQNANRTGAYYFYTSDTGATTYTGDGRVATYLYGFQVEQQGYSGDNVTSGSIVPKPFNTFLDGAIDHSFISSSLRFETVFSFQASASIGDFTTADFFVDLADETKDYFSVKKGKITDVGSGWFKLETVLPDLQFSLKNTNLTVRLSSSSTYSFRDVKLDFSLPLNNVGVKRFKEIDNQNLDFSFANRGFMSDIEE